MGVHQPHTEHRPGDADIVRHQLHTEHRSGDADTVRGSGVHCQMAKNVTKW